MSFTKHYQNVSLLKHADNTLFAHTARKCFLELKLTPSTCMHYLQTQIMINHELCDLADNNVDSRRSNRAGIF